MLAGLMEYGERDKGPDTAILTVFGLLLLLFFISGSGALEVSQTQDQVATSEIVPDTVLGSFRIACCILVIFTLSWIALDTKGSEDYPLGLRDRKKHLRKVVGPTRLAAFTMCSFALMGVNFGVSGAATWMHVSGSVVPEWMLVACPILFSTSYASAILVTTVVTFHLIKTNLKNGHPVSNFFSWYEILMHNGNVAILGLSLLVNGMEVELRFFAFPAVFGIAYVMWSAIYANFISGVFIYDFIDYRRSGAPIIYLILLIMLISFFLVVLALDMLAEFNILLATMTVMVMTFAISTVRNPSQG